MIMVSSEVQPFRPMLYTPVTTLGHAALIMLLELLWYKFQIKCINRIYKEIPPTLFSKCLQINVIWDLYYLASIRWGKD